MSVRDELNHEDKKAFDATMARAAEFGITPVNQISASAPVDLPVAPVDASAAAPAAEVPPAEPVLQTPAAPVVPDHMIPKTRFDEATGKLSAKVAEFEGRFVEANQALTHTQQELAVTRRRLAELEANPALKEQQQLAAVDAELNKLGLDPNDEGNRLLVTRIVANEQAVAELMAQNQQTERQNAETRLWADWNQTVAATPKLAAAVADPEFAGELKNRFTAEFHVTGGTLDFAQFAQRQARWAPEVAAPAAPIVPIKPAVMPQPGALVVGAASQVPVKTARQVYHERFAAAKTPEEQALIVAEFAKGLSA